MPVFGAVALLSCHEALSQVYLDFEAFPTPSTNGTVLFRQPSFSGSTGGKLDATPNVSQVVSEGIPAGNPNVGNNALFASFSFKDEGASPLWLRFTTYNATFVPNPTVSLEPNWGVQFDMYTDTPLYVAAAIRETESGAALGDNGGASGTIEFVGGNPSSATGNRGKLVPANSWTTLSFNFSTEPVAGFTGDGVLSPGADNKGVLEALALGADDANRGTINVWIDNAAIMQIPEPTTLALTLFGGVVLMAALRRRV